MLIDIYYPVQKSKFRSRPFSLGTIINIVNFKVVELVRNFMENMTYVISRDYSSDMRDGNTEILVILHTV